MARSATLEVFRFDPSMDVKPDYVSYEFPIEDEEQIWTVFKALRYINEEIEPISFDYNCRWGGCGRCGMMVNGTAKLACWAKIEAGKKYKIEPLTGFPVIKDLVVDYKKAYNRFVDSECQIKTYEPMTDIAPMDPKIFWEEGGKEFNRCRECMQCYAVCPVLQQDGRWEHYIGPGAMMQVASRWKDPQDQADRLSQAVFSGVFECKQCGTCASVCPAQIKISSINKELMDAAVETGLHREGVAATANWPIL